MKNFCIIFLSFVIIILTAVGFSQGRSDHEEIGGEYLRIHIRADSNAEAAQAVKYAVRDCVVEYLTPLVATCESKKEALSKVKDSLSSLEEVAEKTLKSQGFSYGARAKLTVESFPTRAYGEYVLPAGEYSALVLELGSGEGDNWWCVVYPPLCFTGGNSNIIYKSKILEIIRKFYD